jgi:glycosyltransferase involved in cell wall biosynthesis
LQGLGALLTISDNLLIDLRPAAGAHGERGIGRYVRGLGESIATFPGDLRNSIWALGVGGPALDSFGARAIRSTQAQWFDRALAWMGRSGLHAALGRSDARVFHMTDPQHPWTSPSVPTLVTVYDLIPLRERSILQSWRLDHRVAYRSYLRAIESAARIVAISEATSVDVQERLGIPAGRIDVVYPVVDVRVRLTRAESEEPTFLFVGALGVHKQPELALRAFAVFHSRFRSGRLRFVGPSEEVAERRLRELATSLGVGASVSLEGRIPEDALEQAYASATALVSTSRVEGFGLPPVEAALRGVPVIAVESAAATETLAGVAALVPGDAEAIAEAMAHPMAPTGSGLATLTERYSVASVARSLRDSYRRMLD